MNLQPIDGLSGLRRALAAPADDQMALFRSEVMEPLRPFWEPFMGWGPPGQQTSGDPMLDAARRFAYYSPEHDAGAGLEALDRIEASGVWPATLATLRQAWDTLAPEAHGIALDQVRFTLVVGDPAVMNSQMGSYTGFGAMPGTVMVMAWPTEWNLPRLPAAASHELHHNIRFSFEPFTMQTTLGQYLVAEGLAEAFAAQMCGEALLGPWTQALTEAQIEAFKPRFAEAVNLVGFNEIRGYIFGDWGAATWGYTPQGVPDFAGYTFGYRIARAYLARTGQSAAEATYRPWQEIIAESGYFQ